MSMKRWCLGVVVAALGAAYARPPVRLMAPNAIVSVVDFADGSIQFFLTGDLTRLQGDTVETVFFRRADDSLGEGSRTGRPYDARVACRGPGRRKFGCGGDQHCLGGWNGRLDHLG